jgi:excisionase family DNA binding protein
MKIGEVARSLGVSRNTVRKWIDEGHIPVLVRRTYRGNQRIRIPALTLGDFPRIQERDPDNPVIKAWSRKYRRIGQNQLGVYERWEKGMSAVAVGLALLEDFLSATAWEEGATLFKTPRGREIEERARIVLTAIGDMPITVLRSPSLFRRLKQLLPEEQLSRLSDDILDLLQGEFAKLTPRRREVLRAIFQLQRESTSSAASAEFRMKALADRLGMAPSALSNHFKRTPILKWAFELTVRGRQVVRLAEQDWAQLRHVEDRNSPKQSR